MSQAPSPAKKGSATSPADDDGAERLVAGGEDLRQQHQVGHDAEALARRPAAEPPDAGHHLVADQQHAVAVADLAHRPQVAVGRREDAAGADHRLGEEGGDAVGAELADPLFQRLGVEGGDVLDLARPASPQPSWLPGMPASEVP